MHSLGIEQTDQVSSLATLWRFLSWLFLVVALISRGRHVTLFDMSSKDFQQLRHCFLISVNAKECLASGAVAFAGVPITTGHY